jgi:hypothetical protein
VWLPPLRSIVRGVRLVQSNDLLNFLSNGGARVAIALPLRLITARVERIFVEADFDALLYIIRILL